MWFSASRTITDDVKIFYPVLYVKEADGCVGKSQAVTVKVNDVPQQPEAGSGGGGCFINSVFESGLR